MKVCKACGEEKALDQYRPNGNRPNLVCKSCQDKKNRIWAVSNAPKVREYQKAYQQIHRDRIKAQHRKWHTSHPGYSTKKGQKWRDLNRAQYRLQKQRNENKRRTRLRGAIGEYSVQEWVDLCELYGQTCLACEKVGPLTIDHIIPISRGGSNNIENIQPLCRSCNSKKGTRAWNYKYWFMVA